MTEELKPLPCPFEEWFEERFGDGNLFFKEQWRDLAREVWDAALTRSPAWRDIESAPRDGTPFLARGGYPTGYADDDTERHKQGVVLWWNHDEDGQHEYDTWRYCSYDSGLYGQWKDPVEWLPLPPEEKA